MTPPAESDDSPSKKGLSKLWSGLLMAAVLLVGLGLRTYKLDHPVMWCDEAESCINAMTILQHGLPTSTYLGLPIYENTLTDKWPESNEYEFKDSSYSAKGVAIYHGWLPLYSLAASFKVFGILPDTDETNLRPIHNSSSVRRRTIAARVPGVIFGLVFLVLLYVAGKDMYGRDAGWAAIISAAISVPMVNIARQARYYSLTAALSAACCLVAWRMYSRGRWRDFIIAGFVFPLLFHTHILTFAIACASTLTLVPAILMKPKGFWKLAVFGVIVATFTLPWLLLTGFLGAAQTVPKAIHTMRLPQDLLAWPQKYWAISALLLAGMAWMVLLQFQPKWVPKRLSDQFKAQRGAFFFLAAWIVLGYLMFMLLIPAASLFFQRLYLGAVGPGIIFGAMIFAGFGRAMGGRLAVIVSCMAFAAFAYGNTKSGYWWQRNKVAQERLANLVVDMRTWKLKPGTRVYASPNDHLTLTFYTGIPIQSIAPVRKTFLDTYEGDIVFIECNVHILPIDYDAVREASKNFGTPVTEESIPGWCDLINRTATSRKLAKTVKTITPSTQPLVPFADAIIDWQLLSSPIWARKFDFDYINPSIFRGYDYNDFEKWWQVFFYRFVNPESRMGDHLNYADRMRRADARVLTTLWTVYTSPGLNPGKTGEQAGQAFESR